MKYQLLILKNYFENFTIFPFVLIGKVLFRLSRKKKTYNIFFFFPFYHIGGAEKVHTQIVESVGEEKCIIFFTRKSQDNTFLKSFKNTNCDIKDISFFTDNKWLFFLNLIYRGYISAYINKENKPIVFNGQSNFAYKISPWIRKKIVQIDLIHALNTFSYIRIPFVRNYATSVTVSQKIIDEHFKIYKKIKVPVGLFSRFIFIETRIELPKQKARKDYFTPALKILYAGRGTEEKRVHIVATLAKLISSRIPLAEVHFAGDVKSAIEPELHKFCKFHGNITKEEDLNMLYNDCHILIVSSSTESGPLVTMEAMARGLAILTTDVGFVSDYIENGVNGCKIPPFTPDDQIVTLMAKHIEALNCDRKKLAETGLINREIAYMHFGLNTFKLSYKKLFEKYR